MARDAFSCSAPSGGRSIAVLRTPVIPEDATLPPGNSGSLVQALPRVQKRSDALIRRLQCVGALLCLALLAVTQSAIAGSATDDVKSVLVKAMEIQTRSDLQAPEQRVMRAQLTRQLIADNFLAADMARESLKERWDTLSQAQRREFESLFVDLFQDSYTRLVLNYLRQETVEYQGEQPEGNAVQVQTRLLRTNEHIPVHYQAVQKTGRWLIRDVVIDGVSIVSNYQNQFRRAIAAQSFDELLKKMRLQSQAIREKPA